LSFKFNDLDHSMGGANSADIAVPYGLDQRPTMAGETILAR
jgi:hypothetical protein